MNSRITLYYWSPVNAITSTKLSELCIKEIVICLSKHYMIAEFDLFVHYCNSTLWDETMDVLRIIPSLNGWSKEELVAFRIYFRLYLYMIDLLRKQWEKGWRPLKKNSVPFN